MNAHALGVLEFTRVLDLVAGFASSEPGAERVRALRPLTDAGWLAAEHARVAAMRALASSDQPWIPEAIPALAPALARLRIGGTTWSGSELLAGLTLLRSSRRTMESLRDPRRPAVATAVLAPIAARLVSARPSEEAIERVIADDGSVKDDASPALRRIRRELRSAEGELVALLERLMARLEPHHQVSDASVTLRNGRYVIPVRREGRGALGGIVHDTSATGATVFVEPPAAIEFGNRVRELEVAEQREVDRLLLELTEALRPQHAQLEASLEALVTLDALYARARYAMRFRCQGASLAEPGEGFSIVDGRHPLLLAQDIAVVPFDLAMEPAERTLLVSGPNTGGKTVLLKSLGLASAMMQAGIPAAVGAESRVPLVDDVFADVGDEQSIEASLSTFSAHLRNLGEILEAATDRSLVLVDELGSGTDPLEGAALGGAILEELTRRGSLTIATTHLGALKELAGEVPGVVNASLQFDEVALAPTYRLIKGIPGRSYGLRIARRLRLRESVLARAEERVPQAERDVNALLSELEARADELAEREREVREAMAAAQDKAHRLADRERTLRHREREVEKASRAEARRYLLEARGEIERTIRELKAAGAAQLEEAAREARRTVEQSAAAHGEALERVERKARNEVRATPAPRDEFAVLAVGDWVEVDTLDGRTGRLLELRDGDALVAVGAVKLTVPRRALRPSANRPAPVETVPILGDIPEEHAPSEIDVRGLRALEVEDVVMQALDAAIRADHRTLRIIHGKGTGALRERVAEMLKKDTRVRTFRMGAWNEGGAGVTVAEL
jgi:DNA mismatch repair protein MutS2